MKKISIILTYFWSSRRNNMKIFKATCRARRKLEGCNSMICADDYWRVERIGDFNHIGSSKSVRQANRLNVTLHKELKLLQLRCLHKTLIFLSFINSNMFHRRSNVCMLLFKKQSTFCAIRAFR